LSKPEFVGREAVLEQRGQTPQWRFAGFVAGDGDADVLASDPIIAGDELVGYVTLGRNASRGREAARAQLFGYRDGGARDPVRD